MQIIKISDIGIDELKVYHEIRDRSFQKSNSFIADSPKVVNELLRSDLLVKSILATQEYLDEFETFLKTKKIPKIYIANKSDMEKIVGHKIHHNCMMHAERPLSSELEELGDNIILLDQITSTENIGAIARSAAALGVYSYILPKESPHPYSRRAIRVSMGHMVKLKYHIYDNILKTIKRLQARGYQVIAAEVTPESIELQKLKIPKKWALVVGHEGKGLSKEVIDMCDNSVVIEMAKGVRSFNVAIATSIIAYQLKNGEKNE